MAVLLPCTPCVCALMLHKDPVSWGSVTHAVKEAWLGYSASVSLHSCYNREHNSSGFRKKLSESGGGWKIDLVEGVSLFRGI